MPAAALAPSPPIRSPSHPTPPPFRCTAGTIMQPGMTNEDAGTARLKELAAAEARRTVQLEALVVAGLPAAACTPVDQGWHAWFVGCSASKQ